MVDGVNFNGTQSFKNCGASAFCCDKEQAHKKEAFVLSAVDNKETGRDKSLFVLEMAEHTCPGDFKDNVIRVWPNRLSGLERAEFPHIHLFAVELEGYISFRIKKYLLFRKNTLKISK